MKHIRYKVILALVTIVLTLTSCDIVIGNLDSISKGDYLGSFNSPDDHYTLSVYHGSGGATVDYSILCELVDNISHIKRNIYYAYHESNAEVVWYSNSVVSINGRKLDVSKNESYDGRLE